MVAKREIEKTQIYQELDQNGIEFWFDFKKNKFLHNIDTFYYSVKLNEDLTDGSSDPAVLEFRKFFEKKKSLLMSNHADHVSVFFKGCLSNLNLRPGTFAGFFNICLECPDWFDIFIAPVVPRGSDGGSSVTCEIVVQIRSYMLWMYGVHKTFLGIS